MSCASGLNDQLVCKDFLPFQILTVDRKNVLLLLLLCAFSLMQSLSESLRVKISKIHHSKLEKNMEFQIGPSVNVAPVL